jgi:hypothetical protein
MHRQYAELSPMATITAECPRCDRVFYVDTETPQRWLARHAPGARPGETVRHPCSEHRGLLRVPGPNSPGTSPAAV